MTGILDFLDCMPQTVTLESFTGDDDYGAEQYAAGVDYRARVVFVTEKVSTQRRTDGEIEVTSNGHLWFGPPTSDLTDATPPTVKTTDRITLPDGSQPVILRVDTYPDEDGLHHTKVYFL